METISKKKFAEDLSRLGIKKGMTLLVHSAMKPIGPVEGGADAVIDLLLELLGSDGTLVFPTLTWDLVNAHQPNFDVLNTPSTTGILTEIFRKRPKVIRSLHPTHSVAAFGPEAYNLTKKQLELNTPCSLESPFARLMRNGGFILFLGVDSNFNTCYHAMEEELEIPGLLTEETEKLMIIDQAGKTHATHHHRHAEGFIRKYSDLEYLLKDQDILKYSQTGNAISRLVHAEIMHDFLIPFLKKKPYLLCRKK